MYQPPYKIENLDNWICITLRGVWDMATNIQYLSALANELNAKKGKSFNIAVDMRGWVVPFSEITERIKAPIHLDRRNQRCEVWLEEQGMKVDHIADKFFNEQHVKLTRTYSSSDFLAHINVLENEPLVSHMSQWLQQNQVDKQN